MLSLLFYKESLRFALQIVMLDDIDSDGAGWQQGCKGFYALDQFNGYFHILSLSIKNDLPYFFVLIIYRGQGPKVHLIRATLTIGLSF